MSPPTQDELAQLTRIGARYAGIDPAVLPARLTEPPLSQANGDRSSSERWSKAASPKSEHATAKCHTHGDRAGPSFGGAPG